MSELTNIAAIFAKHLSDAFLSIHHELSRREAPPLSEAPKIVSIERPKIVKLHSYQPRQKILVECKGSQFPNKSVVLERLSDTEYMVYFQKHPKATAFKVSYDQILGLDPDR